VQFWEKSSTTTADICTSDGADQLLLAPCGGGSVLHRALVGHDVIGSDKHSQILGTLIAV